jgi:hypothetical protein
MGTGSVSKFMHCILLLILGIVGHCMVIPKMGHSGHEDTGEVHSHLFCTE